MESDNFQKLKNNIIIIIINNHSRSVIIFRNLFESYPSRSVIIFKNLFESYPRSVIIFKSLFESSYCLLDIICLLCDLIQVPLFENDHYMS